MPLELCPRVEDSEIGGGVRRAAAVGPGQAASAAPGARILSVRTLPRLGLRVRRQSFVVVPMRGGDSGDAGERIDHGKGVGSDSTRLRG